MTRLTMKKEGTDSCTSKCIKTSKTDEGNFGRSKNRKQYTKVK